MDLQEPEEQDALAGAQPTQMPPPGQQFVGSSPVATQPIPNPVPTEEEIDPLAALMTPLTPEQEEAEQQNLKSLLLDKADLEEQEEDEAEKAQEVPSETSLKIDLWGIDQGRELCKTEWAEKIQLEPLSAADFHYACFSTEFEFAAHPIDVVRSMWLKSLVQAPEFKALHANTQLDVALSEMGTASIAQQYAAYYAKLTPQEVQEINGGQESLTTQSKRHRSTQQACNQANQHVGQMAGMAQSLGMGVKGSIKTHKLKSAFARLQKCRTLRNIVEKAGRAIAKAQALQRTKQVHGMDDVIGIKLGDEIRNLIPSELMRFKCARGIRLDFLRRLSERQCQMRETKALDPVGKGPIIICFDESGSMSGQPNEDAKAIGLAMAWVAMHQKRWFAFVSFADGPTGRCLAFPPGECDTDMLLDYLSGFMNGGTTLDVPLESVPFTYFAEMGAPKGKTDMIILTDACMDAEQGQVDRFREWKQQENCKLYSLIIGYDDAGILGSISDQWWCDRHVGLDNASTEAVMSI